MSRIEDLRAQAKAAQDRAKEKALTEDEIEEARLLAAIAAAKEEEAAADATRRAADMAARVDAAERASGGRYLVVGIDLVALFPLGKSPPIEKFPSGGVIIVRSPSGEAVDAVNREVEFKKKGAAEILSDLLCASTLDPAPDSDEGLRLRAFCDAYKDAATTAGNRARELGGAKIVNDKRGRS